MNENTICPCCREHYFEFEDFYEICPVCGWEDDNLQRKDPDYKGGANKNSLNEYKIKWEMIKIARTA